LPLGIGFVVGDDEFAALLEFEERFTKLLQQRRTRNAAPAVHAQVDALDAVVGPGSFDGPEHLEQRQLPRGLECHQVDAGQRIGRGSVGQHLGEVDFQDRLGMHRNAFFHRPGDAQQNENPEEKHQERPHDDRKEPGQKSLHKIHNPLFICSQVFFIRSKYNDILRKTNKIYRFSIKK